MKPVRQKHLHVPHKGQYGDCVRACVASIFELPIEAVPHFAKGNPSIGDFNALVDNWLSDRDLTSVSVPFAGRLPEILDALGKSAPDTYCLLSGETLTQFHPASHTVIVRNGKIVHDPSPGRTGLVAPARDGLFWVTFLVPRHPERCGIVPQQTRQQGRMWFWFEGLFKRNSTVSA